MSLAMASTASQSDVAPANESNNSGSSPGPVASTRQVDQRPSTRLSPRPAQWQRRPPAAVRGPGSRPARWRTLRDRLLAPRHKRCGCATRLSPSGSSARAMSACAYSVWNSAVFPDLKELHDHVGPRDCEAGIELADLAINASWSADRTSIVQRRVVVPQRRDVIGVQLQRALVQLLGAAPDHVPAAPCQARHAPSDSSGSSPAPGRRPLRRVSARPAAPTRRPSPATASASARVPRRPWRSPDPVATRARSRRPIRAGGRPFGLLRGAAQQIQVVGGDIPESAVVIPRSSHCRAPPARSIDHGRRSFLLHGEYVSHPAS